VENADGGWLRRDDTAAAEDFDRGARDKGLFETAYLEIKSTILGGRVLRARTPDGLAQEIYALLCAYQVLRTAMADATGTRPGVDPDRASFTVAINTARSQLEKAAESSPRRSSTWSAPSATSAAIPATIDTTPATTPTVS
jgi:hypothetical protein